MDFLHLLGDLIPFTNEPIVWIQEICFGRPTDQDDCAAKVEERNKAYYAKFPEDAERVKKILGHLKSKKVRLPSDGTLTPRRFQQLGIFLGMHGTYV